MKIAHNCIDYYPFGMQMPGRTFTGSDDYRYGFNGHEKDDDVKGNGNHLSFGNYGYDPRLIRRWNVDPFSAKYSGQSPYSVFNGNPIYFLDTDGNEGVASIDRDNQTVTIKAVYFVEVGKNGFGKNEYKQLMGLNATLNSQGYTITDPKSPLNGYKVKFDLEFLPNSNEKRAQQFAGNEAVLNGTGSTELIVEGHTVGNSIIMTSDAAFEAHPDIQKTAKTHGASGPKKVLGITSSDGEHINIPTKSRGVSLTALHEIFHTLYFDNDGATNGIGSGKQLPNGSDINQMMQGFDNNNRNVPVKSNVPELEKKGLDFSGSNNSSSSGQIRNPTIIE